MLHPVVFVMENGVESLKEELEGLAEQELRKIVSYHYMDPTMGFRRWKKERLIKVIIEMSEVRSHKGDAFR